MKVLVATKETNDPAAGDFCYASEDEMVFRPERCDSPDHPNCPRCGKALAGTRTRSFTNTVKVAEMAYFRDETDAIHHSISGLRAEAEKYKVGAILEVRTDGFFLRRGEHEWQEFFLDNV